MDVSLQFQVRDESSARSKCRALAILWFLSANVAAFTGTKIVTNLDDGRPGSLRDAINKALSGDIIIFSVAGTIAVTNGPLLITNDLMLIGPGAADLALSGKSMSRVLYIGSNATVRLSGFALRDGYAPAGTNAPSPTGGPGGNGANGGGVYNLGRLTLTACVLSGNSGGFGGWGGLGGSGGNGGAIYNSGTLTIRGCTINGNTAGWGNGLFFNGGSGGHGGAIYNDGTLLITNSTLTENASGNGADGQILGGSGGSGGHGGAIYNAGTMTLVACTVARNLTGRGGNGASGGYFVRGGNGGNGGSGGGIYSSAPMSLARLRNTLVALNTLGDYGRAGSGPGGIGFSGTFGTGPDVAGDFTSEGHNFVSFVGVGTPSGFTNALNGDLVGTGFSLDPKIGPLQDNSGPTFTIALLPDSPALDGGDDALLGGPLFLVHDQRGLPRKSGAHLDIGAFELQSSVQAWRETSAPNTNWVAIASSADGRRLIAAVKGGPIYISHDSGFNWDLTSAPLTNWSAVAASADGIRLVGSVAVFDGGQFQSGGPIYTSPDAGWTWSLSDAPITNWSAVRSSADGSKLVAVSGGAVTYIASAPAGPIFRSTDFGATWVPTSVGEANCTSLAGSADGAKLVAASYQSPIYFSGDSGAVWEAVIPGFPYLLSVASSADGTKLLAGTWDPFHPPGTGGHFDALISTNSGASWNYVVGLGGIGRGLVASSADGERLVVAGGANGFGVGGGIFISTDSGSTWTQTDAPAAKWSTVVMSADGCKVAAAIDGGGIWTFQSTPAPRVRIASVTTNIVLSWTVPSSDFHLQETPSLSTGNWTDVAVTPALNFDNLRHEVALPLPNGERFYRLKRVAP